MSHVVGSTFTPKLQMVNDSIGKVLEEKRSNKEPVERIL